MSYKKINLLVNQLVQTQPVEKNNQWLKTTPNRMGLFERPIPEKFIGKMGAFS